LHTAILLRPRLVEREIICLRPIVNSHKPNDYNWNSKLRNESFFQRHSVFPSRCLLTQPPANVLVRPGDSAHSDSESSRLDTLKIHRSGENAGKVRGKVRERSNGFLKIQILSVGIGRRMLIQYWVGSMTAMGRQWDGNGTVMGR